MRRSGLFTLALVSALPVLAAVPAQAQTVPRTWVSGLGDDVSASCARTAPCKTFAGAISKTTANGEINCLDPGGFGPVTITKSITIDCAGGGSGGIAGGGGNAININLDSTPGMIVRLRNLNLTGALQGSSARGISITGTSLNDNAVSIENVVVDGFTGPGIINSARNGRMLIKDTVSRNHWGTALAIAAPPGFSSTVKAVIENVSTFDSNFGFAFGNGVQATLRGSTASSNTNAGVQTDTGATVAVVSSVILGNGTGLQASSGSTIRVRESDIVGNTTGVSGTVQSHVSNSFLNNGAGGTLSPVGGATPPQGMQ